MLSRLETLLLDFRLSTCVDMTSRVNFGKKITERMFKEMSYAIEALKQGNKKKYEKHHTIMAQLEVYFDKAMLIGVNRDRTDVA